MKPTTIFAIYFLIWWLSFFAVLPFGARSQSEAGERAPGTDPGAPAAHRLWGKLLWTTLVATIVFGILYASYVNNLIPFEFLKRISTPPNQ